MTITNFLECGIFDEAEEDTSLTLYVHLKEDGLIAFHDLRSDPLLSAGWLHIEHLFVNKELSSQVLESSIKYISYYRTSSGSK